VSIINFEDIKKETLVKFREKARFWPQLVTRKVCGRLAGKNSCSNTYQKFTFGNPAYSGLHPELEAQLLL